MRPEILQQMLQTVLNIIMFEDCRNQWSMSRPLLGLILLNEDYFKVKRGDCITFGKISSRKRNTNIKSTLVKRPIHFQNLRDQVISSQPSDKRGSMMTWFDNLMEGIERNLLTKNRDRFTQNLSVFRRDINDGLKGPNVTNTSSVNDMMT